MAKPTTSGDKTTATACKHKATSMRISHNGKSRVVYEEPRGGKYMYIKLDGKFVPVKKFYV
jgi:hypothetical protein